MIRAYRDRKHAERERQIADLKFLATAMGASFGGMDGGEAKITAPPPVRIAEIARFLGTTVKKSVH